MNINSKTFLVIFILVALFYFTNSIERFSISRPTKCFSCEKQYMQKYGIDSIWKTMPTKCFSCEKQYQNMNLDPYHTGPTKCFSCDAHRNKRPRFVSREIS